MATPGSILARGAQPLGLCGEGGRPCIGVFARDRPAGGEDFARLAAPEARGAERAHELEVHFGIVKSGDAGASSFDAGHGNHSLFGGDLPACKP
jgi:hypothetical protein